MLFKSKKSLRQWLTEYTKSHQNPDNKAIHYLCVPVIFLSIFAMLYKLSAPFLGVVSALVLLFYMRLSLQLAAFMAVFMVLCLAVSLMPVGLPFWLGVFGAAWVGQFIGHKIEGMKPSFFEDLQFLLIGPAWVAMSVAGKLPSQAQTVAVPEQ